MAGRAKGRQPRGEAGVMVELSGRQFGLRVHRGIVIQEEPSQHRSRVATTSGGPPRGVPERRAPRAAERQGVRLTEWMLSVTCHRLVVMIAVTAAGLSCGGARTPDDELAALETVVRYGVRNFKPRASTTRGRTYGACRFGTDRIRLRVCSRGWQMSSPQFARLAVAGARVSAVRPLIRWSA